MPSLFVTGEILGASGLDNVRRDLSLASLVDLVALSPTAAPNGFFCSWRVDFGGAHSGVGRADAHKEDAGLSQWRVMRGLASGQTQTHQHAAPSADNLPSSGSFSALDAVWAHPIELQLAWEPSASSGSPQVFKAWPRLELTVWRVDSFHRSQPYGRASVAIPMRTGELVLGLPILLDRSASLLDSLARALGIALDMKAPPERSASGTVLDVVGVVHVRVGLMLHGFDSLGIQCA